MHSNALAFALSRALDRARAAGHERERGAGLAEYALLLALIAIACVAALTTLGTTISSLLTSIAGQI